MKNQSIRLSHLLWLALVIVLSACSSQKDEGHLPAAGPSSIAVKAGSTDLTDTVKKNEGTPVGKDQSALFESIMADEDIAVPYLPIGEEVSIDFGELPPEDYVLYDYVLNEDGTIKYSSLATETVSIQVNNHAGTFQLNENLSSKFSSDSSDYEPGRLLRGFLLIINTGDEQQEFAFIIRSDALAK
ncbi:hypothetical protein [Paenibacillus tengchongensis]|uniref:hypothetical protein n=1 Tax=Paenibacillus tengchongensis TaxID=2608684 RepID=UPI00124C7629|nr:hypothetical protein [Paenibacillus tengchongensis]